MRVLSAMGDPPPEAAIAAAARSLATGAVVAVPTDTVYGLAADPFRPGAAEGLFAAKRRPRDVELPVLVADVATAVSLTSDVSEVAVALMEAFWPGALTIVLRRREGLEADLGSGGTTVGVRCPDHPVPLALCRTVGPLATTSANLHGRPTPETAAGVAELFLDSVAVVLDGGPLSGQPSTVVDCTGAQVRLLRPGRIPWEAIVGVAGA